MTSWIPNLNPVPSFSNYTGPYRVGTLDIEIPIAELSSPAPAPDPTISTVNFRIFYPCELPPVAAKPVYWLPKPQRQYFGAYMKFIGASARLSRFLRYLPFYSIISRIIIPAFRDARLLQATTKSGRWPVMVFSHGLGGSKNAYSQIVGAIASHGIVVIAPDHRDGSTPISFISASHGLDKKTVEYKSIPHRQGQDVEDGRNAQLRIRLWELGLVHEALLQIDRGEHLTNIAAQDDKTDLAQRDLAMFANSLDVHTPGRISWSGHSFGAATMIQFLKSVFYSSSSAPTSYHPLFTPSKSSSIITQITPSTPLILFDLWALPLRSAATDWLWQQPLPCYSSSGQGRSNLLAIIGEAFYKWKANLTTTETVLFPKKTTQTITKSASPHVFYAKAAPHLAQSDFGVLWPWISQKILKSHDPIRGLRLNVRAVLELLRRNEFEIAPTSPLDMETAPPLKPHQNPLPFPLPNNEKTQPPFTQDEKILSTDDGSVEGWIALSPSGAFDDAVRDAPDAGIGEKDTPADAVFKGEALKGEGVEKSLT